MPNMKRATPILLFAAIVLSSPAMADPAPPATTAAPGPAAAKKAIPPKQTAGSSAGEASIATNTPIQADPFARLRRVVDRQALKPIRSIRLHDREKAHDRGKKDNIKVLVQTRPSGAVVKWGRRTLGTTPVALVAPKGSTPADLVIRRRGYMVLRTRVQRRISRTYFFKLTPAKFR